MKGHIRERSPGSWAIVLDVLDPETGKRRRKWHSFKGTKREAQKECARLVAEMATGLLRRASQDDARQLPGSMARPHAQPGGAAHSRALLGDRPQEPRSPARPRRAGEAAPG